LISKASCQLKGWRNLTSTSFHVSQRLHGRSG
jgi:hypothetical protein